MYGNLFAIFHASNTILYNTIVTLLCISCKLYISCVSTDRKSVINMPYFGTV